MASTPTISEPADYSNQTIPFPVRGTSDAVIVEARDAAMLLLPTQGPNPAPVVAGAYEFIVTGRTGNRGSVFGTLSGEVSVLAPTLSGAPVGASASDAGAVAISTPSVTVPAGGARVFICVGGASGDPIFPPTITDTLGGLAWTRVDAASTDVAAGEFNWGKYGADWFWADAPAGSGVVTATFPVATVYDRIIAAFVVRNASGVAGATRAAWNGTATAMNRAVTATGPNLILVVMGDQASGTLPAARGGTTLDVTLSAAGNSNAYAVGHATPAAAGAITVGSDTTTTVGWAAAFEVV